MAPRAANLTGLRLTQFAWSYRFNLRWSIGSGRAFVPSIMGDTLRAPHKTPSLPPRPSSSRAPSIERLKILDAGHWHVPMVGRPSARLIAIRGRAGTGKSTIAANLAIAMANLRSRVVLIDLDLENPVQHKMLGINNRITGLRALLEDEIDTLEQALAPTRTKGLYLVSGEGMALRSQPANALQQHRLMEQIWELDADVIIADVGSTSATDLVDLFALGAMRIVVSVADPTSLRRTYNLFKEHVIREIEHVAGGTPEGAMLLAGLAHPFPPMMEALLESFSARPDLRTSIDQSLAAFGGRLIGNRVRSSDESDLMHAATRLMKDYLGISIPLMGSVEVSHALDGAQTMGRPLLMTSGVDRNVRLFHSMAEQILVDDSTSDSARCVLRAPSDYAQIQCASPLSPRHEDHDGSPLPASLGRYLRRHPRFQVDWHGTYVSADGRKYPVRIFDISQSGASISEVPDLEAKQTGHLIFEQLPEQPQLATVVVEANRPFGHAGLQFPGDAQATIDVVTVAANRARRLATL